jgi:transcriptional regulator with XRE-family HTH domain
MARTFTSPQHEVLRAFLVEKRKGAGLRQIDLAERLGRRQDYVSYVETGQKLLEVVELMEWADAIGFDPQEAIRRLKKAGRPRRAAAAGASRAK